MISAFERFCSLFSHIRSFSCSPYTIIDCNSSTIPQAFPGYVPFMPGSRILKDKRCEKSYSMPWCMRLGQKRQMNGTIYGTFVEKHFMKGTISCPFCSAFFDERDNT